MFVFIVAFISNGHDDRFKIVDLQVKVYNIQK